MELKFTGRGAMLYPSEGNTAAYFEEDNNLFLFDCGEDVANKLIKMNKLNKDTECFLFITHTHSDHIGSLGTLQQYLYWVCNKKLNIVYGNEMSYFEDIKLLTKILGLVDDTFNLINENELDNKFKVFNKIRYVKSNHGNVPLTSCSIIVNTNDGDILYTGDIADNKVIVDFINNSKNIDKMYIDASYNKSPVHISVDEIKETIPDELKNKVYAMHINDIKVIDKIKEYGFNLVEIIK